MKVQSLGVKTTCSAVERTLKLALAQSRDASVKVGVAARVQGTDAVEEALPLLRGNAVKIVWLLLLRDPHRPSTADTGRRLGAAGWRQGDTACSHGQDLQQPKAEPMTGGQMRAAVGGGRKRERGETTGGRHKRPQVIGGGRLGFRVQSLSKEENTEQWEREDVVRSVTIRRL
jgi:hypothetical protein